MDQPLTVHARERVFVLDDECRDAEGCRVKKTTGKFRDEPCHYCGAAKAVVDGGWLRERRLAAGLTLREMSRRLGFSAPYICDVELNRRHCTADIREAYEAL